ncbi:MAG: ArgE/DapE family deacylase, partial [Caldiserica bacterium]|nr:ArgE/DapE family deacylase [Caldisericota bacterium]
MIEGEVKNRILSQVEKLKDELINLTSETIKIPSVNPTYPGQVYEETVGGETKVNEFLKPVMEAIGLKTDMWEKEKGRHNLVGVYQGTGGGKSLIFNGHVDVVPPGDEKEWTKAGPWSGKIDSDRIWGRGACDMKGGNAAAIIALKAVLNAGFKPRGDVIIEMVVGEEMMNTEAGTGATLERGYKADGAIVVEPSGPPYRLGIIPASPGVFYMVCTIKGKAVHASMRDELIRAGGLGAAVGVSSIDKAMIIYNGLRQLEEEWGQTKSHPLFTRPGHFTLHPGVITGGPRGAFVISEESRIEYAIWTAPQDKPEDVKKEVETCIQRWAQTDPWLRENPPKVEWLLWWPPFDVSPDAPICKAVHSAYQEALGTEPKYYGFAAVDDAAFLNLGGVPAITIGPGDLRVAHAPNEYVFIDELIDAAKIYAL